MPKTRGEVKTRDRIRHQLESIPGVHRVVVTGTPHRVLLVCDAASAEQPVESTARAALAAMGLGSEEVEVEVSYLAAPQPARRVRFVEVEVARPHVGTAVATVWLEWNGTVYTGRAEGEGGAALELRLCGHATLRALEAVLQSGVSLDLIGVKAVRIFDHDMIAALVHNAATPGRRLIGVAIVGDSDHRATTLAVLSATNRLLGNYLVTAD